MCRRHGKASSGKPCSSWACGCPKPFTLPFQFAAPGCRTAPLGASQSRAAWLPPLRRAAAAARPPATFLLWPGAVAHSTKTKLRAKARSVRRKSAALQIGSKGEAPPLGSRPPAAGWGRAAPGALPHGQCCLATDTTHIKGTAGRCSCAWARFDGRQPAAPCTRLACQSSDAHL